VVLSRSFEVESTQKFNEFFP